MRTKENKLKFKSLSLIKKIRNLEKKFPNIREEVQMKFVKEIIK